MFQYSGKSLFSKQPEWLKLGIFAAITVLAFLFTEIWQQAFLFLFSLMVLLLSRYKEVHKLFFGMLPFLLLVDFSFYFFFWNTTLDLNKLVIASNLRILSILFAATFFVFSTDLYKAAKFMEKKHFPESIYLPFYVMLRFLPELERDLVEIRSIQKTRGITAKKPFKYLKSILLPLLFTMFEKAEDISIAYYLRKKREKAI